MRLKNKKQKAFTIIELLLGAIIIFIIAFAASGGIQNLFNNYIKNRDNIKAYLNLIHASMHLQKHITGASYTTTVTNRNQLHLFNYNQLQTGRYAATPEKLTYYEPNKETVFDGVVAEFHPFREESEGKVVTVRVLFTKPYLHSTYLTCRPEIGKINFWKIKVFPSTWAMQNCWLKSVHQWYDNFGVPNGFIISGWAKATAPSGVRPRGGYILHLDTEGSHVLSRSYTGALNSLAIHTTPAGQQQYCYGAGYIDTPDGHADLYVLSTYIYGYSIWSKTYGNLLPGGSYWDELYSVQFSYPNWRMVVAGAAQIQVAAHSTHDYIMRLKTDGTMDWDAVGLTEDTGGSAVYERGNVYSIDNTSDNNYIIGGSANNSAKTRGVYAKISNVDGSIIWRRFIEPDFPYTTREVFAIHQTSDGGYIMTGHESIMYGEPLGLDMESISLAKGFIMKTNSSGVREWRKYMRTGTGTYDDRGSVGFSVKETFTKKTGGASTGYIVAGAYRDSTWDGVSPAPYPPPDNGNGYEFYLLKYDTLGNLEWEKIFGGADDHEFRDVTQAFDENGDPDGYIAVGRTGWWFQPGYEYQYSGYHWGGCVVKTNDNGDCPGLWNSMEDAPAIDLR